MAFIIGFPILVIITIVLLFILKTGKQRIIGIAILWGMPFALGCMAITIDYFQQPIVLQRKDICGAYKIDTTIYPGSNARWQYNHFKFYITNHTVKLYTMNDAGGINSIHSYAIESPSYRPAVWKISGNPHGIHHILQSPPTLYRSHSRFYYVLKSPVYGNMFFRKVE